jgi:hypothetical protein
MAVPKKKVMKNKIVRFHGSILLDSCRLCFQPKKRGFVCNIKARKGMFSCFNVKYLNSNLN